jgi:3-hydroxyacyl-[acyl-carrier-protein] dehydratase
MTFDVVRCINADHPSLPGHFPGEPLVPGVVILDEVLAALFQWQKDCQLTGIRAVKFIAPLRPGQSFSICFFADDDSESEVDFCCRIEERKIVEGRLQVRWRGKITL